jgi:hypothetical protein
MDLAFKHLIELQQRPASFDVFNNYKFKFVRALLFSLTGEATWSARSLIIALETSCVFVPKSKMF